MSGKFDFSDLGPHGDEPTEGFSEATRCSTCLAHIAAGAPRLNSVGGQSVCLLCCYVNGLEISQ